MMFAVRQGIGGRDNIKATVTLHKACLRKASRRMRLKTLVQEEEESSLTPASVNHEAELLSLHRNN